MSTSTPNHHGPADELIERDAAPDQARGEDAITGWLHALGTSPDQAQLQQTPGRVWQCWQEELLNGYQMSAKAILEERFPTQHQGLVVVKDIHLQGVCPHHLLPFVGRAHVAYLPQDEIVGFSRLADLVQCFARRLTLQETVTQQIPHALMEELGAQGAGCVIKASHMCMTLRAPEHRESVITTSCFVGALEGQPHWQQTIL